MRQRLPYLSIRPYLPHAVAATLAVYGLPLAVTLGIIAASTAPPLLLTVITGAVLALAAGAIGAALWDRRAESSEISFGELIIWSWIRRRHAEDRIEEDARLLGLAEPQGAVDELRLDLEEQMATLRDLSWALEVKDTYTHGHSRRVERHARRTAEALGLAPEEAEDLARAAALHDIGKIRVPDRLLRKNGVLTIEERVAVEEHVSVGATLIAQAAGPELADVVRHHHERWDGTGYPDRLQGREIPLFARIIAVCDAYDAMTSTRPYRAGMGHDYALEVLRREAGQQFDPEVVEAFIATLPARIPAAALAFFALPMRLVRELAVPAKRFGAANLAPAAGAVGAAAVIGASILTPVPLPTQPPVAAQRPSIQTEMSEDERAQTTRKKRTESRAVVLGARVERPSGAAVQPAPARATTAAKTETAPKEQPEAKTKSKPEVETESKPEVDVNRGHVPPGDPQPTKGRDCSHPGDGSLGRDKHCG